MGQCVGGAWAVVGLCDRVEGQLTKIEVAPTRSLISKNAGCGASWWDARRLGTADAAVAANAAAVEALQGAKDWIEWGWHEEGYAKMMGKVDAALLAGKAVQP